MGHDCKISNGITSASLRKQPTFFAPSPSGDSRDRRRTAVFAGYTSTQHGRIPLLRGTFTLMAPSGEMAMVWKLNMLSTATVLSFLVKIKTVTGKTSNSPRASSARCMVWACGTKFCDKILLVSTNCTHGEGSQLRWSDFVKGLNRNLHLTCLPWTEHAHLLIACIGRLWS